MIGVATPQVHHKVVSRPKNVIGADGKIHRQFIRIPRTEKKSVATEAPEPASSGWNLSVKVMERGQISVRTGPLYLLGLILMGLDTACHWRRHVRTCSLGATTLGGCLGIATLAR